ncbi:hypothetical protein SteCoe_22077 [Stentor coeruleus]|uniref:Uncharacterized protein n=1 Tax=Stentor coeruleus TaxID=5963 RepID=A0A1R2BN90_9CILI|nr:hypothetical protein SteCoe_22077 [Stentor coeruleus]
MLENIFLSNLAYNSRPNQGTPAVSRLHKNFITIKIASKKKTPLVSEVNREYYHKKNNFTKVKNSKSLSIPDRSNNIPCKDQNKQFPAKPFKMQIKIHECESVPINTHNTRNKAFLDVENSTNNSSAHSRTPSSHNNSPAPLSVFDKAVIKLKPNIKKPARFLTIEQRDQLAKQRPTKEVIFPNNSVDLTYKIVEDDNEHLHNEILYRRFQKHRLMKRLIIYKDEEWDWSTPGSASPVQKVRFNDVVVMS